MSAVNETRILVQHESCECKCRLNESVCDFKQKWNQDECWCECKEVDGVLVKTVTHGILAHVIVRVTRHVKLLNI